LSETLPDGETFTFVDIETLIKMKEAAGRPKDLDDIEHRRLLSEGE